MSVQKPPERRQRGKSRDGSRPGLVSVPAVVVMPGPKLPAPQPHWRGEVVEGWNDFWSSHLASVVKVTDGPALCRLFDLRHRLLEAQDSFDAQPIVQGSTGQPTMSPWAQEVHRLEAAVSKLEGQFGLTPMARLKLGVTFEQGVSLAQHNAQLLEAFRQSQTS